MRRILQVLALFVLAIFISLGIQLFYYAVSGQLDRWTTDFHESVQEIDDQFFPDSAIVAQRSWIAECALDPQKLLNPDKLLLGVHDNRFESSPSVVSELADSLECAFQLIHIYRAWGSESHHRFPKDEVAEILREGAVPVITWEPWLQGFTEGHIAGIRPVSQRDKGGMADVASGLYDDFIVDWAHDASNVNAPLLIRFGHEMNDPYRYSWGPHNNKGANFVAAWHHIDSIFTAEGATNCLWIWTPHLSYGLFDDFYPGDDFVDFIGLNVLNFGSSVHWSEWQSFYKMFGQNYDALTSYKKPLMITELGSLSYGGDRAEWYTQALDSFPTRFPQIKALMLFHVVADNTVSNKMLDWGLLNDEVTLEAVRRSMGEW